MPSSLHQEVPQIFFFHVKLCIKPLQKSEYFVKKHKNVFDWINRSFQEVICFQVSRNCSKITTNIFCNRIALILALFDCSRLVTLK